MKIISYDLETTGFNPKKHEILEIAAVAYFTSSKELRYFSTLVDLKNIPTHISKITGITKSTLKKEGCLNLKDAVEAFSLFCNEDNSKVLYVGHNIKVFDNSFINPILRALRLPQINNKYCWDTLTHFRKLKSSTGSKMPRSQKSNLEAACKYYKITLEKPSHRALPDAKNALRLYMKQKVNNKQSVNNPLFTT